MSEHGRAIWKAWADGKEVQYKVIGGNWEDTEPISIASEEQPQNYPSVWRIKPEKKTFSIKYRIALIRLTEKHISPILIGSGDYEDSESRGDFIKWITEERVEEVEEPL